MAIGINKMPENLSQKILNRFWGKVAFTANPNCCWEWQGCKNSKGYGYTWIGSAKEGSKFKAHRLAYYLHNKIDPKQLIVQHKCDNPKCCNPNHLELGTDKTNSDDKYNKGRGQIGETCHSSKRKESDILLIRKLHSEGFSYKEISEKVNENTNYIACVVLRRIWKHI